MEDTTMTDICRHADWRIYVDGQYVESAGNLARNARRVLESWHQLRPGHVIEARPTKCSRCQEVKGRTK